MIANILAQLGIVIALMASINNPVDLNKTQEALDNVDEVVKEIDKELDKHDPPKVEKKEEKSGEVKYKVLLETECWKKNLSTKEDMICDCVVEDQGNEIILRRNNCEVCDKFVYKKYHTFNDPATGYFGIEEGYCIQDLEKRCNEKDYWAYVDTDLEGLWQFHHNYEMWMGKCLFRGYDNWRKLEDHDWVYEDLSEGWSY